jgi:hypothetical protein
MPVASNVFPALSCTSFKVPKLILRSSIHFELILKQGENLDLVSPATFVEEAVFSPLYVFGTSVEN